MDKAAIGALRSIGNSGLILLKNSPTLGFDYHMSFLRSLKSHMVVKITECREYWRFQQNRLEASVRPPQQPRPAPARLVRLALR